MPTFDFTARTWIFRAATSAGLVLFSAILTSCASYDGIETKATVRNQLSIEIPTGLPQSAHGWPEANWWSIYGDPQLNQLIDAALLHNPTLASARARIEKAQAMFRLASAGAKPAANVDLTASYGRQSENYLIPKPPVGIGGQSVSQGQGLLDFSIDLDFWGRNAEQMRAAQAQVHATEFDRDAAQLALTTAIARAYGQLAAQYGLREILLATQQQRRSMQTLASLRAKNGLDTHVEMNQNASAHAAVRAELVQQDTTMQVLRLQLAALSGAMPDTAQKIMRPRLAKHATEVPQSLPLDLLGRRPELAAQRARISAAIGETNASKAQFYPNVSLTGFVGLQSIGLNNLLRPGSLISSIGPAIHLPIFDAGRLRANLSSKTAEVDHAITLYNQSILSAAQEVAEQLTRIAALESESAATQAALDAASEAHRLASLRYRGGLSPYLAALNAETPLLAQRRAAVELNARRLDLQITLIRALGGGFADMAQSAEKN